MTVYESSVHARKSEISVRGSTSPGPALGRVRPCGRPRPPKSGAPYAHTVYILCIV
jgi:hypothetical protein